MRNTIKYLSAAVMLCFGVYGQTGQLNKGDKEYEKCAYVDAVKVYEKVFDRGYKSADMLKKLGNAYYFQADYEKASKWYGELFSMPDTKELEYYYRYAQSLKATQNYAKADEVLNEFYKKDSKDHRVRLAVEQKNYLDVIKQNSDRYTIGDTGVNTNKSDYGSGFFGNKKIVFASARGKGEVDTWQGGYCTDLYTADLSPDGSLSKPAKLSGNVNTKYNESSAVVTKDGKTMYFTRNNYTNGKKGKDKNNLTLLKLYTADKDGGKWKNVRELPFSSDNYSVAHPALSPDENLLYFVSDMPGSIGESDIYKVSIKGKDSYGTPENLGPGINTEGKETFPFISANNELYFASDGYPGLGGLDIFMSRPEGGEFGKPQNVGEPVNSSSDDFAFLIDTNTKQGFFSSNRSSGAGSDDIYNLKENKEIAKPAEQSIAGVVTYETMGKPIADATVILSDSDHKYLREVKTGKKGKYDLGKVDAGIGYTVRAEKKGYNTVEKAFTTDKETGITTADIALKPEKTSLITGTQKLKVGDNLATALGIDMVYFDLDKSNIRPDVEVELAKVLAVMEQYPTMNLDIRSHTDCRQTARYNLALSARRAKATIDWLVKHGIDKSRLTGRGYGETQLLNKCGCEPTNKSNCTESEHQRNRRSEFIISKV